MSNDASVFFKRLIDDADFRSQFTDLTSHEAVIKAADAAGYQFTAKEMKAVLDQDKGVPSLSEGQLDSIAARSTSGWVGAAGSAAAGAVAAGAAAAACV